MKKLGMGSCETPREATKNQSTRGMSRSVAVPGISARDLTVCRWRATALMPANGTPKQDV